MGRRGQTLLPMLPMQTATAGSCRRLSMVPALLAVTASAGSLALPALATLMRGHLISMPWKQIHGSLLLSMTQLR